MKDYYTYKVVTDIVTPSIVFTLYGDGEVFHSMPTAPDFCPNAISTVHVVPFITM